MFMSIFKGKARGLGEDPRESVYMKVGVDLRKHLHHFKGAKLAVFMAIALHADENGESFPSYEKLEQETGYGSDTIATALKDLCKLEIEGCRILVRYREKDEKQRYVGGNRYLIFPTQEECQMWDKPDVEKSRCGKIQVEVEPVLKAEPRKKEENIFHAEKSNVDFPRGAAQQSMLGEETPQSQNGNGSREGKKELEPKAARPKKATNPNTQPILAAYLDLLGYKPANTSREAKAAKAIADAGYTPEQVVRAYQWMLTQDFWKSQAHISLASVANQIGGILNKLRGNGNDSHSSQKVRCIDIDNLYT